MIILHVVGTRPNFVKIALIMKKMACYPDRFQQILVHTGQHYDDEMSQVFFDNLDIRGPGADLVVERQAARRIVPAVW
jgi:UDP-N-acetylglucosamine 2-epimerase